MGCIERAVSGSRDAMTLHESLGKFLRAFQHCPCFRWTNHWYGAQCRIILEKVINTVDKRILRTNDHHIDAVFQHKTTDFLKVVDFYPYILGRSKAVLTHFVVSCDVACSGITRCHIQFLHLRTLAYLPCQCMFTTSTSQQ